MPETPPGVTPDWAADARTALATGPAAMVSIVATEGSAPRGAGTRMIVGLTHLAGTIGGGRLEHQAAEQARAILDRPPGTWRIQDYPLGPLLGQCCGGRVRLLVERLDPGDADWLHRVCEGDILVTDLAGERPHRSIADRPPLPVPARGPHPAILAEQIGEWRRPLWIFGAGHVGQAIARTVRGLPFTLAWFDSRPEFAGIDGVTHLPPDALVACAATIPADAGVVILTHDHALDYDLAVAALRGPAAFVGLIGSATKRARFVGRLAHEPVDVARLTCPIGVAGIVGKEPAVIAIAVAAQLLAMRDTRVSHILSDRASSDGMAA